MSEQAKKAIVDAYVDADDRVLDPTLLDKSVLERMPQPTGWRMLVCHTAEKTQLKAVFS